jgi:uncharacterized membrane protein YvbJ
MKYCPKCGAECGDNDNVCTKCGEKLTVTPVKKPDETVNTVIKVFNILSCVCLGFTIIGLAWAIPMTLNANKKMKNGEPFGVALSVCTLIFLSTVSGILMLVQDSTTNKGA